MRIAVIHGPNLNLLGSRQPEIYGRDTLDDLQGRITRWADRLDSTATFSQSNDESDLVAMIQDAGAKNEAILLNVGGFTHTSVAIADAVASIAIPTVEVHLSDINRREPWRRKSLIKPVAVRQISGRGATGYRDAMRFLVNRQAFPAHEVRYGPHEDNVTDLRTPTDANGAGVVLVHGGFWLNPWERDTMDSLAVALAKEGYTTGNVEYRRTPAWPASGQDVEMAVRHFAADGMPIAVIGHSAGGYLGMWATARCPVDHFIGLAAISDLERARPVMESAATLLHHGAPALVSPPATHLMIHGGADKLVDPEHTTRLGDGKETLILPDVGHFDVIDPSRAHMVLVLASLEKALG